MLAVALGTSLAMWAPGGEGSACARRARWGTGVESPVRGTESPPSPGKRASSGHQASGGLDSPTKQPRLADDPPLDFAALAQTLENTVLDEPGVHKVETEMTRHGGAVTVTIPDALCDRAKGDYTPAPLDLCCVIDTSASMCAMAALEGGDEMDLTVMDLTKQCVRHLAQCLGDQDTLSVVTFSGKARIELEKTRMNAKGQEAALRNLNRIEESGPTNLFDGIESGLKQLGRSEGRSGDSPGRHRHVIVLTDGQPTIGVG